MNYLVWYGERAQKSSTEMIQNAMTAYVVRCNATHTLVLVNTVDQALITGVLIHSEHTVQPNTFWVGMPHNG